MAYPDTTVTQVLLYLTIAFFFCVGIWAGRGSQTVDVFLTARSSQGWLPLGLNFFAAGMQLNIIYGLQWFVGDCIRSHVWTLRGLNVRITP